MMKRIIWCLFVLLLVNNLDAQRLLSSQFTKEELKDVLIPREAWTPAPGIDDRQIWDQIAKPVREHYLSEAENLLDYQWPSLPATTTLMFVRDGNRSIYDSITFSKRRALGTLLIAELLENEGRFLDQITNGIWSICEESSWCVSAHLQLTPGGSGLPDVSGPWVDLFAAETVNFLAWADYFLGEKLDAISPQIRKRIRLESNRRIFTPLLTIPHMWMDFAMNWNPWICSNWISSVLLLETDQEIRAKHVAMALTSLDNFLDPYPDDGGCDEGPGYWNAAGSSLFESLEVLNLATNGRYQVFDDPKIRNIGSYIYKVQLGERYFINFADASPTYTPAGKWIYRFGERINDPLMMQFGLYNADNSELTGGTFHFNRKILLLTEHKLLAETGTGLPLPAEVWFPDIQVMLARDQAGSMDGFCLAAKGGHNQESHNHNDVGNFIVYHDGKPLLIDVGSGTYTARFFSAERYSIWMTNSAHHNVPLINGMQQPAGLDFKATEVSYSRKGKKTVLGLELKSAYPADAGIDTWIRTFTHTRGKGINLAESFELDQPGTFSEILMTTFRPDLSTPGEIVLRRPAKDGTDQEFSIQYDDSLLKASFQAMPLDEPEDIGIIQKWGPKVYRIELKSKISMQKGEIEIEILKR